MQFLDEIYYVLSNEFKTGPEVRDMVSFLASCPELYGKPKFLTMLCLGCLLLPHVLLDLMEVRFLSAIGPGDRPETSELIRPVLKYLLSNNAEGSVFAEVASISECMELPESFVGTAVEFLLSVCGFFG